MPRWSTPPRRRTSTPPCPPPHTRSLLPRSLAAQADQFFAQCDPSKENLCLYGYADGSWEVTLPSEEVPAELPEPALGINFARDGEGLRLMDALLRASGLPVAASTSAAGAAAALA